MMAERREEILELYYRSNSVQFGQFRFSVHEDNPDLPLSPNKLHYPKPDEPGAKYLPELFHLIGDEFFEICEAQDPPLRSPRIAAVPEGAWPLADSLAQHYPEYPENLLIFSKVEKNGISIFLPPEGGYEIGDEMRQVDDHTSAGRNAKIFRHAAKRAGLVVTDLLSVVDREQGGVANMAADGARMLAILTISELLDYGVAAGHITQDQANEAKDYNAANQFEIGYHVIPVDNTPSLLEKLLNDPLALASCDFHENFLADVIFAAPNGTYYNPDVRIVAYCAQHIIKGAADDLIPLLDQTRGWDWARIRGYAPLLERENLESWRAVLAELLVNGPSVSI